MPSPALSIVIPTHKRAEILRECLRRIEAQTVKDRIEAIVVHDGEDAPTEALFSRETFGVPTTFFSIPKSQQGTARNRGVERAKGEIVLFIGDDIFLESDACEKHLAAHENQRRPDGSLSSVAVLGHMTWDPALDITPVMRWLEATGWELGFTFLTPHEHAFIPTHMQERFTYGGNVSIPAAIAGRFPFREEATIYGWEDIAWGLQLKEEGVPLFYEPDARAFHHHRMTMEDSLRRMETLGRSAVLFEQAHPGLGIVPKGWKRKAYEAVSLLPTLRGRHSRAFLRGIRQA